MTEIGHVEGKYVIIGENALQQISYYGDIIVRVDTLEELPPKPGQPPYKGLTYYTEADADLFFGREQLSDDLAARLETTSFLAVAGASGSGKSSLLRAGVVPRLRRRNWLIHILTPTADPLSRLAESLTAADAPLPAVDELCAELAAEPQTLRRAAGRLLGGSGAARLLLVIDQFEELFTQCHDEAARRAFIDNLLAAARDDGRVTVLLGLRADFTGHLAEVESLRARVEQSFALLGPMQPEELVKVIAEPAKQGGWAFVSGLMEQILSDVGQEPGRLPLLSHALLETWQRRAGHVMTLRGYREAGGVEGAIAKTAEDTLRLLEERGQEGVAQAIFLSLTELGEGSEDTRRIARRDELARAGDAPAVDGVLNTLAAARLVMVDRKKDEVTVEVAHEALIRRWPRLRAWLTDNRERLRLERQLEEDAREWLKFSRDPSMLYRGGRLAQGLEWQRDGYPLSPVVVDFLAASQAAAEAETRAARQLERAGLVRRFAYGLAALAVVAVIAALAAGVLGYRANQTAGALSIETTRVVSAEAEANSARATSDYNAAEAQVARATSEFNEIVAVEARVISDASAEQAGIARATAEAAQDEAEAARAEVERLNRETRSRRLAAEAENMLDGNPELALLLAAAAYQTTHMADGTTTSEARVALNRALDSPLRLVLAGHEGQVLSAAFSPDGTRIVSAGQDQTARVWDSSSGETLLVLRGHDQIIWSAAFSPGGEQVVTASFDGTARIWDATSGDEQHELSGHGSIVWSAAFSPDGTLVATAGDDGTARLWDAVNGEMLTVLTGHEGGVLSATFSPDGRQVVTASEDGTARLWDVANGEEQLVLRGHTDTVWSAAFSPDGTMVATVSDDRTARLWDVASGEERITLEGHTGELNSVAFSPDGKQMVTASADGTARLWDAVSGEPLEVFVGHLSWVVSAAFSPDGRQVVTVGWGGPARLWDVANGNQQPLLIGSPNWNNSAVFSPDGSRLITANTGGTVQVWDVVSGEEQLTLSGHEGIVWSAEFSPDGSRVVTAGVDGTVRLWDATSGAQQLALSHEDEFTYAMFSPGGRRVVASSGDGTARVWDAVSGEEELLLSGHAGIVWSAAFSPDGSRVLTAGDDGTARLWDATTGDEQLVLKGHNGRVRHAAFSPDGRWIVTAGEDGTARLWDAVTGDELAIMTRHWGPLNTATFSSDGTMIVTASEDWTARVWAVQLINILEQARQRSKREPRDILPEFCEVYFQDAPNECPQTLADLFGE